MRYPTFALLLAAVVAIPAAAATQAAEPEFRLLELDGQKVSWTVPAKSLPPVVTYALIADARTFANARNCGSMLPTERALEPSHIARSDFLREVRAAFAMWQHAAEIDFRETTDPLRADILIGAQAEPRGRAFTNVARRDDDRDGAGEIQQSLICLNPEVRWKIGFDGNLDVYDLRYTIAHEIGHAIGLDHPGRDGQLMSYRYAETSRELMPGDIKGAVTIYGRREPARTVAARAMTNTMNTPHGTANPAAPATPAPPHRQLSLGLDNDDRTPPRDGR